MSNAGAPLLSVRMWFEPFHLADAGDGLHFKLDVNWRKMLHRQLTNLRNDGAPSAPIAIRDAQPPSFAEAMVRRVGED